jgi:cupin fold WbuC family metalloprotein
MQLIDQKLIDDLIRRAGAAPRHRSNRNLHPVLEDPVQRLFVAAKADTYFRPHLHPARWECALVIRGAFDVCLFDDAGVVTQRLRLSARGDTLGFEIPERTWHGWVAVEDDSVFFEVKQGPYDPVHGITFAAWAPPEGDPGVPAFLGKLKSARVGEKFA